MVENEGLFFCTPINLLITIRCQWKFIGCWFCHKKRKHWEFKSYRLYLIMFAYSARTTHTCLWFSARFGCANKSADDEVARQRQQRKNLVPRMCTVKNRKAADRQKIPFTVTKWPKSTIMLSMQWKVITWLETREFLIFT